MKYQLLLLLSMTLLLSCGKSTEDKAASFAENEIKKSLNYPESYESVELMVDSVFTKIYTDDEVLQAADKIIKLRGNIARAKIDYDHEKSTIAIFSGPYMTALHREEVRQAIEKMNQAEENIKKYSDEINKNIEIIKTRNEEITPGVFYGWAIAHRFRYANKQGDKYLHNIVLISDKDFENLILAIDESDISHYQDIADVIDEALEREKEETIQ